jgi:Caspase domain
MYTKPAPLGATHVALCIGNSKYASSPLRNAGNDAQDMAALCTKLGFATELVVDASLEDMLSAVTAFSGKLSRGGVSLFFYAGASSIQPRVSVRCQPTHPLLPRPRRRGKGPELPDTHHIQGGGRGDAGLQGVESSHFAGQA